MKRTIRIRAALAALAATALVALGIATVGASKAVAAIECTGARITGGGSSLQKIAQQSVWAPTFNGELCKGGPTVTFDPSGSGLEMWNAYGTHTGLNLERPFVATDEAPTSAQIATMRTVAGGAHVLVIPVAQTAVTVIANPPPGCVIENITNQELEEVFRGDLRFWSEVVTSEGSCASPIIRVVRKDGNGVTRQLKSYFDLTNPGVLPCAKGKRNHWAELEAVESSETGAPNTVWPESCEGHTLSAVVKPAAGGAGEEIKKVNATAGSIGYAALPDAKANKAALILNLQNNGNKPASEATYASLVGSPGSANCGATSYVVPEAARKTGTGLDVDWSGVSGIQQAIGGTAYPLCMLTYALALQGYGAAGYSLSAEKTVHDYIREYVNFQGQTDLEASGTFYAGLPLSAKGVNDVVGAAKFAAGKINF